MEGFGEGRIVKEETDNEKERSIKEECLQEELERSTHGPLRLVPKECLLSAEGLKAHRTGKFLDLTLKRRDTIRAELEEIAEAERAVKSVRLLSFRWGRDYL